MVMTTENMMGKPKNKTKDEAGPRKYHKPVLPAEPPARLRMIQKYKKDDGGKIVPDEYVIITYNHIGRGRGGQFKLPRAVLETFWKAMQ